MASTARAAGPASASAALTAPRFPSHAGPIYFPNSPQAFGVHARKLYPPRSTERSPSLAPGGIDPPRPRRHLAAHFVQVAQVKRLAQPAVRHRGLLLRRRRQRPVSLPPIFRHSPIRPRCGPIFPAARPASLATPPPAEPGFPPPFAAPAPVSPRGPAPRPPRTLRPRSPSPWTFRQTAALCAPARPRPATTGSPNTSSALPVCPSIPGVVERDVRHIPRRPKFRCHRKNSRAITPPGSAHGRFHLQPPTSVFAPSCNPHARFTSAVTPKAWPLWFFPNHQLKKRPAPIFGIGPFSIALRTSPLMVGKHPMRPDSLISVMFPTARLRLSLASPSAAFPPRSCPRPATQRGRFAVTAILALDHSLSRLASGLARAVIALGRGAKSEWPLGLQTPDRILLQLATMKLNPVEHGVRCSGSTRGPARSGNRLGALAAQSTSSSHPAASL